MKRTWMGAWILSGFGLAPVACAVGVEEVTATGFGPPSAGPTEGGENDDSTSDADDAESETGGTPDPTDDPAGDSGADDGSSETGVPECGGDDLDGDPQNCGACGHDCGGGGCSAGVCGSVQLASGVTNPWRIRVHGSSVFVGGDDGVLSIPTDGGKKTVLAGGLARGLVVDDERVYWGDELDGSLYSTSIGGGARELVVVVVNTPYALEGDDENLYWIDGGVMKRAKQNGVATEIVPADGNGFVPWQLALDDARIYWRSEDGELRSADKNGGGGTVLATGNEMRAVAVNATHVFAMRRDGFDEINTLLRIPKAGGATEALIDGQQNVLPLLADEESVYWATEFNLPTRIHSMPVAGGPVRILAQLASSNAIFTVHEKVLYWAEQEEGTIHKLVL